jgi:TP901 family phage tail tape measure protein
MADETEVGRGKVKLTADTKTLSNEMAVFGDLLGAKLGPVGEKIGKVLGGGMGKSIEGSLSDQAGGGGAGKAAGSLLGVIGETGPWGIAAAGATAATVAIGAGLYKLGGDFEGSYRQIARTTGATGQKLKDLKGDFNDVLKSTPASMGQVAQTIEEVQRYTGPAAKNVSSLSKELLTMSRISGTDVKENSDAAIHAFENWGVSAKNAPRYMNQIYAASQKSGDSFSDLAGTVTKFGPALRALGYGFTRGTAMVAEFHHAGLNTSRMMMGMQTAAVKLAKEQTTSDTAVEKAHGKLYEAELKLAGASAKQRPKALETVKAAQERLTLAEKISSKIHSETLPQAFQKTLESIKHARNETDALAKAGTLFGARGGVQLVDAIRRGKFGADDLTKSLGKSGDAIDETANRTQTVAGAWGKLRNQTEVALQPISSDVFRGINAGLIGMAKGLSATIAFIPKLAPLGRVLIQPIKEAIRTFQDLMNIFKPEIKFFYNSIRLVIDLLTGKWGKAWGDMKKMVGDVVGVLKGFAKLLLDEILQPFRSLGPDVDKAIVGFLKSVGRIPLKVVSALAGLASAVWGVITDAFDQVTGWAESAISSVWGWLRALPGRAVGALIGLAGAIWAEITGVFDKVRGWAESAISNIWGWLSGLPGRIVGAIGELGSALWDFMNHAWTRVLGAFDAGISGIWHWLSGLGPRIVSGLGDIGTQLWNYGVHIMQRFVDGIGSMAGSVAGAVGHALGGIGGLIPHSPAKYGPLSGAGDPLLGGQKIVERLAQGVTSRQSRIASAMSGVLAPIGGAPGLSPAMTSGGGIGGPAVVVQNAQFSSELEIETFMRQAAFIAQTKGL